MSEFYWSPSYSYNDEIAFSNLKTSFENGAVQVRQKWPNPKRTFKLVFNNASLAIYNEIKDFFIARAGGYDSFTYTNPDDGVEYLVRFVNDSLASSQVSKNIFNFELSMETV